MLLFYLVAFADNVVKIQRRKVSANTFVAFMAAIFTHNYIKSLRYKSGVPMEEEEEGYEGTDHVLWNLFAHSLIRSANSFMHLRGC